MTEGFRERNLERQAQQLGRDKKVQRHRLTETLTAGERAAK